MASPDKLGVLHFEKRVGSRYKIGMVHHLDLVMLIVYQIGSAEKIQDLILLVVNQVMGNHLGESFRFPALDKTAQFQLVIVVDKSGEVGKLVGSTVRGDFAVELVAQLHFDLFTGTADVFDLSLGFQHFGVEGVKRLFGDEKQTTVRSIPAYCIFQFRRARASKVRSYPLLWYSYLPEVKK